jgi:UDP-N-acetyl-D-glucosamine/UDP-N-acetyl-D-galactosamine dehydrogenase
VLILGLTFKENCPDVRNTKVVDVVKEFETYGADVDVYDPWVDKDEAREVHGIEPVDVCVAGAYDAVVLCVGHEDFKVKGFAWVASLGKGISVLYDVKNLLPVGLIDGRL